MFAQEPPPDVEVPSRRQPRERPEVVAEVGLVVVAGWMVRRGAGEETKPVRERGPYCFRLY
jgi:hypothetical protein